MKYDHMVKVNGKYYQAGQDVPENKKISVEGTVIPYSDIELVENVKEKKYTKSDINRMKAEDLQELAASEGIENSYEKSGNELKKILAEHFGL